jgi:hypothetical protein
MKSNNSIIVYENDDFVTKQINKLNIKKATGYDGISPKFRNRWQDTDRTVITFIKTIILFKKGDTWAAFIFSGKTDWSIDLLIKTLMGFVNTG